MAERGAEASRKLLAAYLTQFPDAPSRLDYTNVQLDELAKSLGRINDKPTGTFDNGMEISSDTDTTGRKLVIKTHPSSLAHELIVVAAREDKLPREITQDPEKLRDLTEPYGSRVGPFRAHMMRLMMVSTDTVGTSQYEAIAKASMIGESLPNLGLRPRGGFVNRFLRAVNWVALYDVAIVNDNRYVVTIDRQGQETTQETLAVLSRKFTHGTGSYLVLARVANVGRPPRAA